MNCQEISAAIGLTKATEHWTRDEWRQFQKAEEIDAKRLAIRSLLQAMSERFIAEDKRFAAIDFIEKMPDAWIDLEAFKRDGYNVEKYSFELKTLIGDYMEILREILLKSNKDLLEKRI